MSNAPRKHAYGFCDRTGFRYDLKDLIPQFENGKPNGLLVGRDMADIDHEQLRIGDVDASDRQALDDPRPDTNLNESRALSAWNPVGGGITSMGSATVGLDMSAEVGRVTVD
jgi:hypothetical protein